MTVRIVCDTASDLPSEIVEDLGIVMVPLSVRFGMTELLDREQLSTKEFWARCASSDVLPQTAAPPPGAFITAFQSVASEGGDGIVCITVSSKLSATNESAAQAARTLSANIPVEVVDSCSVTMGEGLVALASAEAASQGASMTEVLAVAESTRARLSVYGAIDNLENLRKGGRIGGAAAAFGTLLSIKPVIQVRDGVVEQESRQRTRARSLKYLADKVRAAGPLERWAVIGADASDFDRFVDLVADIGSVHPRLLGDIGPVIGTHAGRGAIGVAWVTAPRAG